MTARALPGEYELIAEPPTAEEYLLLRQRAGLGPKRLDQAEAAVRGGWAAVRVIDPDGVTVGMGRVIADGGWYFHIVDMAVLPEHQRRGIGDAILTALIDRIRAEAPPGAWVNLLADPPGRRLYARHGFSETAPHSIGMALTLD